MALQKNNLLNKYIKENGVVKMIDAYAKYSIDEIFKIISEINRIMYSDAIGTLDTMGLFRDFSVEVSCLTNNSFMIFTENDDVYDHEYYQCVEIEEIQFNSNEKEYYMNFMEDSIKLINKEFTHKYYEISDTKAYVCTDTHGIRDLNKILDYYDVEFYNIKFLYSRWSMDNRRTNCDIKTNYKNKLCNLQDIFPIEQKITIKFDDNCGEYSINIHNLEIKN
jgi:hypothetical protein